MRAGDCEASCEEGSVNAVRNGDEVCHGDASHHFRHGVATTAEYIAGLGGAVEDVLHLLPVQVLLEAPAEVGARGPSWILETARSIESRIGGDVSKLKNRRYLYMHSATSALRFTTHCS